MTTRTMKSATTESVNVIATTTDSSSNTNMTISNNVVLFDDVVAKKMKETSQSSEGDGDVQDVEDHRSTPGSIPSSSTPIASSFVLEVAPRNGRWGSKDPLFRGVCLYDGTMTREQVEKYYSHNTILATTSSSRNNHNMEHRSSWTPLSVFRLFF